MTPEEKCACCSKGYDAMLAERFWVNHWKAQARLYMIELAKVNRACAKKAWHIKVLREQMRWLERDMGLFRLELKYWKGLLNLQMELVNEGEEKGREK